MPQCCTPTDAFFKDMNFPKLFQTECIRVIFIPGDKNHKSNHLFPVIFSHITKKELQVYNPGKSLENVALFGYYYI